MNALRHSVFRLWLFTEHPEVILTCDKREGASWIQRLDPEQIAGWRRHGSLGQLWMSGHIDVLAPQLTTHRPDVEHGPAAFIPEVEIRPVLPRGGLRVLQALVEDDEGVPGDPEGELVAQRHVMNGQAIRGLDNQRGLAGGRLAVPEPVAYAAAFADGQGQVPRDGAEHRERLDEVGLPRAVGPNQDVERRQADRVRVRTERQKPLERQFGDQRGERGHGAVMVPGSAGSCQAEYAARGGPAGRASAAHRRPLVGSSRA